MFAACLLAKPDAARYNGRIMFPPKVCPVCHGESKLDAGNCLRCGHVYRTRFVSGEPLPADPPAPRRLPLPATRRRGVLFPALLLVGLLLFVGIVLAEMASRRAADPLPVPAAVSDLAPAPLAPMSAFVPETTPAPGVWAMANALTHGASEADVLSTYGPGTPGPLEGRYTDRDYRMAGGMVDVTFEAGHVAGVSVWDGQANYQLSADYGVLTWLKSSSHP